MAKRKRSDPDSPNQKRLKGNSAKGAIAGKTKAQPASSQEYKLKSILKEDKTRYLISWEDDPVTGEQYAHTWEPKENANQLAVKDWEAKKARQARQALKEDDSGRRSRSTSVSKKSPTKSPSVRANPKRRARRVIESSPQATQNGASLQAHEVLEIGESQPEQAEPSIEPHQSPLFEPQSSDEASTPAELPTVVAVQPSSPPSSYLAGAYQKLTTASQIASSASILSQSEPVSSENSGNRAVTNTYEDSFASATPSQQRQTAAAFTDQESVSRFIPDSQSIWPSTQQPAPIDPSSPVRGSPNSGPASVSKPSEQVSSGKIPVATATELDGVETNDNTVLNSSLQQAGSAQFVSAGSTQPSPNGSAQNTEYLNNSAKSASAVDEPQELQIEISSSRRKAPREDIPKSAADETSFHSARDQQDSQAYIDLTSTQQQSTRLSKFTVTPPRQQSPQHSQHLPHYGLSSSWTGPTQGSKIQSSALAPSSFPAKRVSISSIIHHSHSHPRAPESQAGRTLPEDTSTSILAVPSQSIVPHTPGESAPPRPPTFSSPHAMASPSDAMSLSAKTKTDRERRRLLASTPDKGAISQSASEQATSVPGPLSVAPITGSEPKRPPHLPASLASPFAFTRENIRSPSVIPAEEPVAVITYDEMTTAGRYETLLPQSQGDSSTEKLQNGASMPSAAADDTLASQQDPNSELEGVHAVPIYLVGHQRDQYPGMVYFYKDTIQKLLTSTRPDEALMHAAEKFIQRVRRIALHPDLDNAETYTQYDVTPSQQSEWDVRCSAKFRFLRDLFVELKTANTKGFRVAILVQPGRAVEILQMFLKGIKVSTADASTGSQGFSAAVYATEPDSTVEQPADLVIAMDNTAKYDSKQIRSVRKKSDSQRAPFITLVVPRSVEHIDRNISNNLPAYPRLRALVSGVHQYRDEAGRSQGDLEVSYDLFPSLLVEYLLDSEGGTTRTWPLPELPELEDLDSQTDSELEISGLLGSTLKSMSGGEKRSREPEDVESTTASSAKRSRVESPAAGAPVMNEGDVTHISDSIGQATQPDASGSSSDEHSTIPRTALEKRLQTLLLTTQTQKDQLEKALSDLQYRHEDQRTKLLEVTTERDAAIMTAQTAVSRLSEESNKMSNLRAENSSLKDQLKDAREKLLNHSVPERAAFEALQQDLDKLKSDKEKADRKLEQAAKDTAYVRELYQNASSAASTASAEVAELKNDLAVAENKATSVSEAVKLRGINSDTFTQATREENRKLKSVHAALEKALRGKDEEIARLRESARGRMDLRLSPKPGSRGTSPATGEFRGRVGAVGGVLGAGMGHPLRNAER